MIHMMCIRVPKLGLPLFFVTNDYAVLYKDLCCKMIIGDTRSVNMIVVFLTGKQGGDKLDILHHEISARA